MIKHIRLIPLFLGLVVGVIAILYIKPEQAVVYKYPTPENCKDLIFKDKNSMCYKYSTKEVDCDKNESRLKSFPLNK